MAKFTFSLEAVRKLRLAKRDERRTALADAFRADEVLQDRRSSLRREQAAARELQHRAMCDKYLDVNRLLDVQRYDLVLNAREQELTKQEILLAAEIERRRDALIESDRAVRALDILEEKQRAAYQLEENRKAAKQLDEIAILREFRK